MAFQLRGETKNGILVERRDQIWHFKDEERPKMAFQLSGETTYGILGTQNVQIMHFRQEERPKLAFQVQSARKRCRFTSKIGLNILNLYKGSFIQEKVDTLGSSLLPIACMHAALFADSEHFAKQSMAKAYWPRGRYSCLHTLLKI